MFSYRLLRGNICLTSVACLVGMNQLLWYYADLEKRKCYHTPDGLADFDNEDKACSTWRRFAK
jgi:hypothetical protein